MGEYTGRRRGRAASEPSAPQPGYPYAEQGYQDPYAQPQPEAYGYEYGNEFGYENVPGYEQPGYHQAAHDQGPQEAYYQDGYYQEGYQRQGYQETPYYEYAQPYAEQYGEQQYAEQPYPVHEYDGHEYGEQRYAEPPYAEQYAADRSNGYSDDYYSDEYADRYGDIYTDERADRYADEYPEPYVESHAGQPAQGYYPEDYADVYVTPDRLRAPLSPVSHLPYIGAATVALAVAAFVSAQAVAAVVLPLQLVVAWAVLDLAGFASRRTAVLAALPALAGVIGSFEFQPDDAVLPVAAGLGAGFVLIAADAVFRARRRGVEPGSVRALAAAASALLFAGLTGLFVPAADLRLSSAVVGAGVCAFVWLPAARNPELGISRAAVVAIPVTIAALASYAAAILVP